VQALPLAARAAWCAATHSNHCFHASSPLYDLHRRLTPQRRWVAARELDPEEGDNHEDEAAHITKFGCKAGSVLLLLLLRCVCVCCCYAALLQSCWAERARVLPMHAAAREP